MTTLAAAAPLILYQMYVWGNRVKNLRTVAWCAYFAYIIGQFLRPRPSIAPASTGPHHYSAECTHAPGDLASALVKIAYGMVKIDGAYRESQKTGSARSEERIEAAARIRRSNRPHGNRTTNSGMSLALGMANPQQAAAVMKWDLVNPWARVIRAQLHPPAHRPARTRTATTQRRRCVNPSATPCQTESEGRKIRWGAFPVEFFFWIAPFVCTAALLFEGIFRRSLHTLGVSLPHQLTPWLLIAVGTTWAMRIAFRYRGTFEQKKIGQLLEDLDVSQMTPRAVELRGEIIGNVHPRRLLERRPRHAGRERPDVSSSTAPQSH